MAERISVSPPPSPTGRIGTDDCPHVADLINFALGQGLAEERRRVELHLEKGECTLCQGWVDQARLFREERGQGAQGGKLSCTFSGLAPPPLPTSDPTPIP